jgi:hypothetical protein
MLVLRGLSPRLLGSAGHREAKPSKHVPVLLLEWRAQAGWLEKIKALAAQCDKEETLGNLLGRSSLGRLAWLTKQHWTSDRASWSSELLPASNLKPDTVPPTSYNRIPSQALGGKQRGKRMDRVHEEMGEKRRSFDSRRCTVAIKSTRQSKKYCLAVACSRTECPEAPLDFEGVWRSNRTGLLQTQDLQFAI